LPATGGTDDSGKVVVDIAGVQRASVRLADAAQAYDQLAARIRNRPLPEMPAGLAAYVTAELAEISRRVLHINWPPRKFPSTGIHPSPSYERWRKDYWAQRAKDFQP
jgi:hypothetical protein